ncbi:PHP domain-containing protein [Haloarchaeobius amylolyticus]|uniref:PHP domain-containing protein n=1 Tax=Haloarchaeobius amylolyticus TaxID=1198296 RepID=UPI002271E518|nr:PHP domain-containing protein [Haloarchaeobius amylolyticus]
MVYADLHVHTTNSDGQLELDEVPAAAREAGVSVVAITDHDRISPALDAPVTERDGVTLLHGIELRVDAGDQRVDLLGYGVRETHALTGLVEHIQQDRIERGQAIIDCVEDRLDVSLGIEGREGLGRPHIARAVADHPDADYDYAATFDHLIGDDCPCYVARDVPTFERGREALLDACGLVSLAHPLRYPDPGAALELCAHLPAVERYYHYGREVDTTPVERAVREYDLLVTGGSDAHDYDLGLAGLSADQYEPVAAAVE